MTRMKILMLFAAVSTLSALASCSSEAPIEVIEATQDQPQAPEVKKADTFTIILTPMPHDDDDIDLYS